MDLATNLRYLREQKRITQRTLCDSLEINPATYNSYEINKSHPDLSRLIKLADFYSVSLDYLVGRDKGTGFGYLSENETIMVDIFRQLKTSSQFKVMGFAQAELERE